MENIGGNGPLPEYPYEHTYEQPIAVPVAECHWCGQDIHSGDVYYKLPKGEIVCAECIGECKHTAY